MDTSQVLSETKTKLSAVIDHLREELKKLRTGRAHPGMLDSIMVEVYGQSLPLKGVGTISAPEAQLLQITPFDPGNLRVISDAIRTNELGLNPSDDGRVVRIQIPPLTAESRQQMIKILHQKIEEAMISTRQIRHEALRRAEAAQKDKSISKDDLDRFEKQIDELLSKQKTQTDELSGIKEREITNI